MTRIACPNCGGSGGGPGYYSCSWCNGSGEYDARDKRGRHLTYAAAYKQASRSYHFVRGQRDALIRAWQNVGAWFNMVESMA